MLRHCGTMHATVPGPQWGHLRREAASAELRHAFRERLFRRMNGVGRSDMHPDAVEPQAEQALLLICRVEHPGQRELAFRRAGKDRRREDRGTRIDERNDLMFAALA